PRAAPAVDHRCLGHRSGVLRAVRRRRGEEPPVTTVQPVRRQLVVGAPPERAFALFTERIGEWWPMADHSVFGDAGTVAFEGEELVERAGDRVAVWAEVTAWDPPAVLELTWHPGRTADLTTRVRVTFEPDDRRTLVTLEHD